MKSLLVASVFLYACTTFGQSITVEKKGLGYQYLKEGDPLSHKELKKTLSSVATSKKAFKAYNWRHQAGGALLIVGGGFVLYPIGQWTAGGEPHWEQAAFGALLAGLAIPLQKSVHKKAKNAIELYNASQSDKKDTKLTLTPIISTKGIGLIIRK